MSNDYLFATPVLLTKGELLQLHVLAGENMSISEYCKNVLREHIAAQQKVQRIGGESAAFQELYQGKFDPAPEDDSIPPHQPLT